MNLENKFRKIFRLILDEGKEVSPRHNPTIEVENVVMQFGPYDRFMNFKSRKLKLDYLRREWQWILRGDPLDLSILRYAKIWEPHVTNGKLNSNYGQYWFNHPLASGFDWVVSQLLRDRESRRAVMPMIAASHLYIQNNDFPCTQYLSFRIRDNKLNCSAHMRSNDLYFGTAINLFMFSTLQEMIYVRLCDYYSGLSMGTVTIHVDSLHCYKDKLSRIEKMANDDPFEEIHAPKMTRDDVSFMVNDFDPYSTEPAELRYYEWLMEVTL